MTESHDLQKARAHLNSVNLLNRDAEYHIDEGFFTLEEIAGGDTPEKARAGNLGRTYMQRFRAAVEKKLAEKHVPEPDLEALLRSVTALEASAFASGFDTERLRLRIASRLIDSYFQGYSEAERSAEIRRLMDRIEKERESSV